MTFPAMCGSKQHITRGRKLVSLIRASVCLWPPFAAIQKACKHVSDHSCLTALLVPLLPRFAHVVLKHEVEVHNYSDSHGDQELAEDNRLAPDLPPEARAP